MMWENLFTIVGLLFDLTGAVIVVGPDLEDVRGVGLQLFNWLPWTDRDYRTIERGFAKIRKREEPITPESNMFVPLMRYLTIGSPRNSSFDVEQFIERYGLRDVVRDEESSFDVEQFIERYGLRETREGERLQERSRKLQDDMESAGYSHVPHFSDLWRLVVVDYPDRFGNVFDAEIKLSDDGSEIIVDPAVDHLETENFNRVYYEERVERDIEKSFLRFGVFLFIIGFSLQIIAQAIGIIG